MKLSIIILTCNSKKWIEPCIKSLISTIGIYSKEWIVVDNGSNDGSQQLVRVLLPQAIIIQNKKNLGVARARNQGIESSTGEYVLLLDDDTEVLENTINAMCRFLDEHPRCGMVGPQLVNPDGSIQYNALELPSVRVKIRRVLEKIFGKPPDNYYKEFIDTGKPFHPGYLLGACQLIRRDSISSVGLLDEQIFYGPEDADYCLRLKEHSYDVVCLPSVRVIHAYQKQSYRLNKIKLLWHHFKGLWYFWKKHRTLI